jgi:benzodiazapine receptor
LYFLMGVSLYLFVRAHNPAYYRVGLIFFGIQLCLNFFWTLLFFGLKNPLLGLLDIVAMAIAIAITIWIFWNASHAASLLLVPYLCWVSFATYLNTGLLILNR